MREVSIDQDFAAEKNKPLLDFSDWRLNPEDLHKASELQQEQCWPAARKSRGPACEWSSSCETYSRLHGPDCQIYDAAVLNNFARLLMSAALASPITK